MYLKIEQEAFEQAAASEETQNPANVETEDNLNNLSEISPDDE